MADAKLCKSIVMEIRPRLQSVNVFITLTRPGTVNITLNLDYFKVTMGLEKQNVSCRGFHIVPNSLSCLINKENYCTFRFSTENVQQSLGMSRCELLPITRQANPVQTCVVLIKTGLEYQINCTNCTQAFCKEIAFERVLPLPESLDTSEWFCHADKKPPALAPNVNEAFYSNCFVHLSHDLLRGFVSDSSTTLICSRCLAWIGVKLKTGVCQVWFNTVTFKDPNNSFKTEPLDDAFATIRQLLRGSIFSSNRIVLTCQSCVADASFLLLWVLEKELQVCFDCGEPSEACVAKVLFTFDRTQSDLVCQWLSDVNVSTVDVSKPMMVKLLEHLYDMNAYIPKDFSRSNDFYISYLMLFKENTNK